MTDLENVSWSSQSVSRLIMMIIMNMMDLKDKLRMIESEQVVVEAIDFDCYYCQRPFLNEWNDADRFVTEKLFIFLNSTTVKTI